MYVEDNINDMKKPSYFNKNKYKSYSFNGIERILKIERV